MLIDFVVEGFAEGDNISVAILGPGTLGAVRSKPEVDAIKKMKTRGIHQQVGIGAILRAEEDGRREDSLKALDNCADNGDRRERAGRNRASEAAVSKWTVRLFCWTARVATQMGIKRSWPKGTGVS